MRAFIGDSDFGGSIAPAAPDRPALETAPAIRNGNKLTTAARTGARVGELAAATTSNWLGAIIMAVLLGGERDGCKS